MWAPEVFGTKWQKRWSLQEGKGSQEMFIHSYVWKSHQYITYKHDRQHRTCQNERWAEKWLIHPSPQIKTTGSETPNSKPKLIPLNFVASRTGWCHIPGYSLLCMAYTTWLTPLPCLGKELFTVTAFSGYISQAILEWHKFPSEENLTQTKWRLGCTLSYHSESNQATGPCLTKKATPADMAAHIPWSSGQHLIANWQVTFSFFRVIANYCDG